ncbi:glycosyltransferase family 2 protein [Spirosoma sordidisoli]|uniref:Glycosyltransferase n=1 Tax=Spirosoma sordidisoli TaxID=2502893 RepID=A0A4Q2URN2_9BACT|nr:glycosyltransferase family 2 protein [Spirosoma sordidisoli]RYC72126.1 glycosyltransferase [Spirosoma sordidisoli]
MKKRPTCSLLISTYNWPDALRLCLLSAFRQSVLPNEIIVCDDGSRDDTRQLIDQLRPLSPVPLLHVWQPDEGFQLARIRNKGLARSSYQYILQIDSDIILHRHYVKDQLANARQGFFFSGNRYYLSPDESTRLLADPAASEHIPFKLNKMSWRRLRLPVLQNPMRWYYHWPTEYLYTTGCNMAFWRQDLVDVNGYDESFKGWGWEDTDLALRLMNKNVSLQFIRFGAIQFHIYHREVSPDKRNENYARAMVSKEKKIIYCQQGMSQYLLAANHQPAIV